MADVSVTAPLVNEADLIVHFAAETHVDRSIQGAGEFITTDVYGTFVLLEAARSSRRLTRFIQISTDEVYGSVPQGASKETDELKPRNPYAASKAGADRVHARTGRDGPVVTRQRMVVAAHQGARSRVPCLLPGAVRPPAVNGGPHAGRTGAVD